MPRNKGDRPRYAMTLHGCILIQRRYQVGPDGVGEFPVDSALGIDGNGFSPGAREVMCRFGMTQSFRGAAADARRYVGVAVGRECLRNVVEREGARIAAARDSGDLPAEFTAADAVVDAKKDPSRTRMYIGVDGVMAPVVTAAEKGKRREKSERRREVLSKAGATFARALSPQVGGYGERYKEMKLVTFYTQDKEHMHVAVTGGDCHQAAELLLIHAAQVRLREVLETISLTDGAVWIRQRLLEVLPRLTAMLLDFFHLTEHIHAAAVSQFGETPEAGEWTRERTREFKEMSPADALGAVAAALRGARTQRARDELDRLMGYVSERIEMLRYKHALANGWDIGSGPTEAQCKTTTTRPKIAGAKWNFENLPSIMNLIAMWNSGQWRTHWGRLAA